MDRIVPSLALGHLYRTIYTRLLCSPDFCWCHHKDTWGRWGHCSGSEQSRVCAGHAQGTMQGHLVPVLPVLGVRRLGCAHTGGDSVPWLSHPPLQAAPGKIYQLYTTFTHSSQGRCPCSWQAVELDEFAAPFQPRPLWDVVITREKRKTQK